MQSILTKIYLNKFSSQQLALHNYLSENLHKYKMTSLLVEPLEAISLMLLWLQPHATTSSLQFHFWDIETCYEMKNKKLELCHSS
jgi:hypothetical protein